MSRRADPQRIYEAQRAGIRQRLIVQGVIPATADSWITAWEAETSGREDLGRGGRYWDAGWNWIAEEREKRAKP
jgi:hypothetical protein